MKQYRDEYWDKGMKSEMKGVQRYDKPNLQSGVVEKSNLKLNFWVQKNVVRGYKQERTASNLTNAQTLLWPDKSLRS